MINKTAFDLFPPSTNLIISSLFLRLSCLYFDLFACSTLYDCFHLIWPTLFFGLIICNFFEWLFFFFSFYVETAGDCVKAPIMFNVTQGWFTGTCKKIIETVFFYKSQNPINSPILSICQFFSDSYVSCDFVFHRISNLSAIWYFWLQSDTIIFSTCTIVKAWTTLSSLTYVISMYACNWDVTLTILPARGIYLPYFFFFLL